MKKIRRLLRVSGIVQGVGFRPFIYSLAVKYDLCGWVNNDSEGVIIDIEGLAEDIDDFISDMKYQRPPLADIETIETKELELKAYQNFTIKKSSYNLDKITLIPPDIASCSNCEEELSDHNNHRYQYPFTTCTDCGPRYSIIRELPYDRLSTTMDYFPMCESCRKEYHDPLNRRFHAQTLACPECGPELFLVISQGKQLKLDNPLKESVELLKKGKILAIKGLGGFQLICDPFRETIVKELRKRKQRPDKPFAVMFKDLDLVKEYCYLSLEEEKILTGMKKAILLLEGKKSARKSNCQLASNLSLDNKYIAVMLPYTPLHKLFFHNLSNHYPNNQNLNNPNRINKNLNNHKQVDNKESVGSFKALLVTSANISGMPLEYTNQGALKRLNKVADYFLFHNREINLPVDDSLSQIVLGKERLIRRARGYAPLSIKFPGLNESLACGSYLKNTIALAKGDYIFLSQHLGDISNLESYQHYKKVVAHFKKIYQINPQIIAHDFHTGYLATQFAQTQQGKKVRVQHHHAHIVSCMLDNQIKDRVIGLAFDGAGLGTDDKIWGGEFLICDYSGFERIGQLKYVKMPGGEKAVEEPWRMATSYLYHSYGDNQKLIQKMIAIDNSKINEMIRILQAGLNTPQTSSMGRFFDAVSALLGLANYISYQAQAAIRLESLASNVNEIYTYHIENNDDYYIVNTFPLIRDIVRDIETGIKREVIAGRFHNTIIDFSISLCELIKENYKINAVALSGGVFQNRIILEGIYNRLKEKGFEVYIHSSIPCNDGGVSVGQLLVANYIYN